MNQDYLWLASNIVCGLIGILIGMAIIIYLDRKIWFKQRSKK